ncbi:MAG: hypothetical protein SGPRY_015044 [Prymnesium sp.]
MRKQVYPDDPRLSYSGYVQKDIDSSRAAFPRRYADNLGGFRDAALQSPGASVRWRTNAEEVTVVLEYLGTGHQCSESCARRSDNGECYSKVCQAQCAVLLYVDGQRQDGVAKSSDGKYKGTVRVLAMAQQIMSVHQYEVVLPWNAVIELRSIELSGRRSTPQLMPNPPPPHFTYIAYGDSIVQGWCAPEPYPQLIARRNGWQSVNMGIAGMGAVDEQPWGHGAAVAQMQGDLISVAIGINDFWW